VIVTNNSGQALQGICVRYTFTNRKGGTTQNAIFIHDGSLSQAAMTAGESRIFTYGNQLHAAIARRKIQLPPPAAPQSLSVSIDLVVYSDLHVAGPDIGTNLSRQVSRMRGDYDVCSQLGSGSPSAATLTLLEAEAAANVPTQTARSTDWHAMELQEMSERLLRLLHSGALDEAKRLCDPFLSVPTVTAALHR
jgi:hypothetical protein